MRHVPEDTSIDVAQITWKPTLGLKVGDAAFPRRHLRAR